MADYVKTQYLYRFYSKHQINSVDDGYKSDKWLERRRMIDGQPLSCRATKATKAQKLRVKFEGII